MTWFEFRVARGADCNKPGIYEWRIADVGVYSGKYSNIRRPTEQYIANVSRLLHGQPYRKGKPDGFRRIHRELAKAVEQGHKVTLIVLENPGDGKTINQRERELIKVHGTLNGHAPTSQPSGT